MHPTRTVMKRIIYSLMIGFVLGALINEVTFLSLRETARTPQVIELIIPAGTAESIARGETPPSLPDSMIFVVGDTLLVRNNDITDHELGPLWIPAGTSASLPLNVVQSFAYGCSFQPDSYFGLDVREPLTLSTRLYGIIFSGLPLGVLIALYTLVMPAKKKKNVQENV